MSMRAKAVLNNMVRLSSNSNTSHTRNTARATQNTEERSFVKNRQTLKCTRCDAYGTLGTIAMNKPRVKKPDD
jgi:hypothetical protein